MSYHDHGHDHELDDRMERWTAENWDQRYSEKPALWSGHVNAALAEQASGLQPGLALDMACGEGGDALWLAAQGWQVVGVDVSSVALGRARTEAEARGLQERIDWQQRDLLAWRPDEATYDLVSVSFLHLPPGTRTPVYRAQAAAVKPGGSFLVVAHHPSDLDTTVGRPPEPDLFFTPDELIAELDDRWRVVTASVRPKAAKDAEGREVTVHDTVLRATRGT